MSKAKKGDKMTCVPCGREVVISNTGVSKTTIWCCGKAMANKSKPKAKTTAKKKK